MNFALKEFYQRIDREFRRQFSAEPVLYRSPGRVNLIGEHTDYNEGFVLPATIDKAIVFAISPNRASRYRLYAADLGERIEGEMRSPSHAAAGWPNYLLGVIDQFDRAGFMPGGIDCVFGGNIPIGAGLSSSAAIEGGLAFALNDLFKFGLDSLALVRLAQKAENEFVGVQCGIMDQFINIHGQEKKVLRLDCRSLDFELYPFERDDLRIVLCDTGVRRELASSEYNVRRRQCEGGVALLNSHGAGVKSLRDVSLDMLQAHRSEFDQLVYRRCAYVVQEDARVEASCKDLLKGDFHSFGERLYASHAGLRDEYEVSCAELDMLVETSAGIDGVYGSRMMGGGFGGCTINLVDESAVHAFIEGMTRAYRARMNRDLKTYVCTLTAGTCRITD